MKQVLLFLHRGEINNEQDPYRYIGIDLMNNSYEQCSANITNEDTPYFEQYITPNQVLDFMIANGWKL